MRKNLFLVLALVFVITFSDRVSPKSQLITF
jgi:hypothetical protein